MKNSEQKHLLLYLLLLAMPVLFTCRANAQSFVKDIEGNIYPVIKVGEHEWMAQNLRVKHNSHCNPKEKAISSTFSEIASC